MHAHGQNAIKTYDSQWKIVEDFLVKGLPKSALEEVRKIYQLAKKEKQDAQVIKAVTQMISLDTQTQDDSEMTSIQNLQKELAGSQGAVRAILTSLIAKKYFNYYQQHRWQLYERTATEGPKSEDITAWGTEDFHAKISELYLLSLQPENLLRKTMLTTFDEIIAKGNTRNLRPTLYDLLAQEALQYFSSDERNIKKATYAFEINTASAFDPAADFIHRKFESKDTTGLEYFALKLYQKLVAFHLADPKPDALIDIDLQRLQYVRNKSVHPDKEQLYFMAVNHIAEQYQSAPAAAQAWFMVAAWHNDRGNGYQPLGDSTLRYERVKAAEICDKVVRENPKSEGGINAFNLLNSIREKRFSFETENVNVPEKPILALFNYRNIDRIFLRIIPATGEIKIKMKQNQERFWNDLVAASPKRSWQQALPDTKDHQEHRVEIKVDALPVGEYMLIACSGADFTSPKALLGARLVTVSNLGYVRNEQDLFVLNRDTGQPVPQATVKIWQVDYDYSMRITRKSKSELYLTDLNGYIKTNRQDISKNYAIEQVEITSGTDKLALEEDNRTYYHDGRVEDIQSKPRIFLFTDRSVYRPGQTVFFKGIMSENQAVSANSAHKVKVVLFNVNDEEVEKKEFGANEYGSFSGTFQLPKNGLNGSFRISADENGFVNFQVEEYKRPKFEVTFDTLKIAYKINDTIRVTGNSRAYAGNLIEGAKVSFRVIRNARFPMWRSSRWWSRPSMTEQREIAHGETVTDASGKFLISFEALPDKATDRKLIPVFDYTVYADVTDINGETRSGEMLVSAGYQSLVLKAEIPEKLATDSLAGISIRAENVNGQVLNADIKIKIAGLSPEKRLIRNRLWEQADQFVMTKAEYLQNFPNDEYADETSPETWPVTNVVAEHAQPTSDIEKFRLPDTPLNVGFYKIEITASNNSGEQVTETRFFEVTEPREFIPSKPEYLFTRGSKPIEPGDSTEVAIGSSADNLFVISRTWKKVSQGSPLSFFPLDNRVQTFKFTATETDRGGYVVTYLFVKHNRVHKYQEIINVPWTNKNLSIEYLTFRDKTLPGSKEQWKIRISGNKKEKVAAEILASMYDASLDQFATHQWSKPNLFPSGPKWSEWNSYQNFEKDYAAVRYVNNSIYKSQDKMYDRLLINGFYEGNGAPVPGKAGGGSARFKRSLAQMSDGVKMDMEEPQEAPAPSMMIGGNAADLAEVVKVGYGTQKTPVTQSQPNVNIVPRKNFNETAFFLPDLHTNKDGEIEFSFTLPEALTRWKFQALAHTKELAFGYSSKQIITQKELMVQPNAPRFLREGDKISFPAKVVNLSDHALDGDVSLLLFDTETNQPVDVIFKNQEGKKPFSIQVGQSVTIPFSLEVPKGFTKTVTCRVIAKAGKLSDGEENVLPVLSNRMLVTESMPLNVRGSGNKDFRFEKLLNSGTSKTLGHQMLTVEYTSNPAWYAVQALPYLMEYPYECAEQTWNRYYANSLAAHIVGTSPRIAKVFETWKKADTTALVSNLEKNQELKSVLLEETPWVLAAKSESEQKRNIALLFDLVKMGSELDANLEKLIQMQSSNGGFVWFKGGPDDRYITQYIVTAIGHLKKIGAVQKVQEEKIDGILKTAIPYLDKRIKEDYDRLIKAKADLKKQVPGAIEVQYLYARSFFPQTAIPAETQKAYQYFRERAKLTWVGQSKYLQGLTALALHRTHDLSTPKAILKSLKDTAIMHEELGMYWKNAQRGWWWHEAPIERQALLIEAFQEISNDTETVDNLKTWLLKNKQTNRWESTKATAEACYALLSQGSNWLADEKTAVIQLGETIIKQDPAASEAGTGYFKKSIEGEQVNAKMGNVRVEVKNANTAAQSSGSQPTRGLPGWGAIYWQYFEDLDKITFAETPLKLSKKLFIEKNSDKGPVLTPVSEGNILHIGDKLKVRIELRADRDMEYVHMKDMRASGLEPVNVLSEYKWQGGLGYYETTKDASTNFFFSYIRKGTYVFEYPLFVTHEGNFSNGITSIQCMYAPEFTAHSEGVRVDVKK